MIEINGIAHVYVTVADLERVRPFYRRLLAFLGMRVLVDSEQLLYCIGGRTGVGVRSASAAHADTPFDQHRAGLHHLCFRARSREDVDEAARFVAGEDVVRVHGPREDDWAPGYYSVLFEDPLGTRLEVNYVPGRGHLEADVPLPLSAATQDRLSEP